MKSRLLTRRLVERQTISVDKLLGKIRRMRVAAIVFIALLMGSTESRAQPLSVEATLDALGNDRSLGMKRAPVSVVEFSDFLCSYCRKFWANTLPKLKDVYVKQGKVRFAYRHFAILGKLSKQAALASECAAEQGKFWDYHDKLFLSRGGLAFTQPKLEEYGAALGLKEANFKDCLRTGKYRKKVEGETAVATSLGARATPTFFVNGRLMVGAQPFTAFQAVIEEELKRKATVK